MSLIRRILSLVKNKLRPVVHKIKGITGKMAALNIMEIEVREIYNKIK